MILEYLFGTKLRASMQVIDNMDIYSGTNKYCRILYHKLD